MLTTAATPLEIPWGNAGETLPIEWPRDWPEPEVVRPDIRDRLDDYPTRLAEALDAPLGADRLEAQVGLGSKVAIVVDDPSRWTPVREALPIVLERLIAARVRPEDVTISVGVGRHIAV